MKKVVATETFGNLQKDCVYYTNGEIPLTHGYHTLMDADENLVGVFHNTLFKPYYDAVVVTQKIDDTVKSVKDHFSNEDIYKLVKRKRQYIDEVMDFFDFATVAKTMKALEWKWHDAFEGIPAEHEIRTHARKLMNSLSFRQSPNGVAYADSGGLCAEAFYNDKTKEMEGIRLHFVVAEWDAYDGE